MVYAGGQNGYSEEPIRFDLALEGLPEGWLLGVLATCDDGQEHHIDDDLIDMTGDGLANVVVLQAGCADFSVGDTGG